MKISGGLLLLAAVAGAMWLAHDAALVDFSPALGLALVSLVLVALVLAAAHRLSTVSMTLALAGLTLVVAWGSTWHRRSPVRLRVTPLRSAYLWIVLGMAVLATSAVFAVRYSSGSATADADRALSTAVWAYQSGGQLHIGAAEPPGHGTIPLQVYVTQGKRIVATWHNILLASSRTWQAPPLTVHRANGMKVVARSNERIIAVLPIRSQG
jgi:hypothetical protein